MSSIMLLIVVLLLLSMIVMRSAAHNSYHRPVTVAFLSLTWLTALATTAFLALVWEWDPISKEHGTITGIVLVDEQSGSVEERGSTIAHLAGKIRLGGGKPIIFSYHHLSGDQTPRENSEDTHYEDTHYLQQLDGKFQTLEESYPLIKWIQEQYGPLPIAVYSRDYPAWLANAASDNWPISWIDAGSDDDRRLPLRASFPKTVFLGQPFSIKATPPNLTGNHKLKLFRDGDLVKTHPVDDVLRKEETPFELVADRTGSSLFQLRLTDENDILRSEYTFPIQTLERPHVTYISPYGSAAPLAALLKNNGFDIDHISPSRILNLEIPAGTDTREELIVLDSLPTALFSEHLKQQLSSKIRNQGPSYYTSLVGTSAWTRVECPWKISFPSSSDIATRRKQEIPWPLLLSWMRQ